MSCDRELHSLWVGGPLVPSGKTTALIGLMLHVAGVVTIPITTRYCGALLRQYSQQVRSVVKGYERKGVRFALSRRPTPWADRCRIETGLGEIKLLWLKASSFR